MGSGKSSVARDVAQTHHVDFLDTDQVIEATEKNTISALFSKFGEAYFRNCERSLSKTLAPYTNTIISTGGGFMLHHDTAKTCASLGPIVYLETSLSTLEKRIALSSTRPLASSPNTLKILYQSRVPAYEKLATWTINTDNKSVTQVANELWTRYERY